MHLSQLCSNLPAKLGHQHMGFLLAGSRMVCRENNFQMWKMVKTTVYTDDLFLYFCCQIESRFPTFRLDSIWGCCICEMNGEEIWLSQNAEAPAPNSPTAPATPCEGKRNHPHMHPEVHTWPPNGTLVVHCFIWHFVYELSYLLSAKLQFLLVSVLLTEELSWELRAMYHQRTSVGLFLMGAFSNFMFLCTNVMNVQYALLGKSWCFFCTWPNHVFGKVCN